MDASALAGLRAATLQTVQMHLITELFVGILFGVHIVFSIRYFVAFGGRRGDQGLMQVYVAVMLGLGTMLIATTTAVSWEAITEGVENGFVDPRRTSIAQVLRGWSIFPFAVLAQLYWVWRACRVTQSWFARGFAMVQWLAAAAAFCAFSTVPIRQRAGHQLTLQSVQVYALVGIWTYMLNSLWCAGVLMYELVWKRRAQVVRSSVIAAFTALALRTSALICMLNIAGAIAMTISFTTGSTEAFAVFDLFATLFPFASGVCTYFCLLNRNTLRLAGAKGTAGNLTWQSGHDMTFERRAAAAAPVTSSAESRKTSPVDEGETALPLATLASAPATPLGAMAVSLPVRGRRRSFSEGGAADEERRKGRSTGGRAWSRTRCTRSTAWGTSRPVALRERENRAG